MADLKNVLQEIQSGNKEQETNLYEHLKKIFSKILLENPVNSFDIFEDFSYNIKFSNYDPKIPEENAYRMKESFSKIGNFFNNATNLYAKINVGTEEDPQDPGPTGYIPNFLEEAKLFEWAGVYFGEDETFMIFKSLIKMAVTKQVKQVKFWGKILGRDKDYYIAEGILEGDDGVELPPNVEPKGQGINKMNYWVTNDLLEEWKELPVISPEQLNSARKVKRIFSGNLEENIIVNPFFHGKEKHLLKAQIVRIAHSTAIVPVGLYKQVEDDVKSIEYTEDYKFPSFEELSSLNSWVHLSENILKEGRLVHFKPEFGPDDDEEIEMKKIETKDPFETRLKPISQDINGEGCEKAWVLKTLGDKKNYDVLGKVITQVNYGIISVKSLIWPGLVYVYQNKSWQSIYVGYGFKSTKKMFYPKDPQVILEEPNENEEQKEPNFPIEEPAEDKKDEEDN